MDTMQFIKKEIERYISFAEKEAAEQKIKKNKATFRTVDYINAKALYEYYMGQIDAYKRMLENIEWAENNLEN